MSEKKQQTILKIVLIFVLLQPLLDILSRGAILGYIPNISKYVKPIFVFGLTGYLFFYSPKKKRWLLIGGLFALLVGVHSLMLMKLLVDKAIIMQEFRFMVNIAYMIALYISFDTLCYYSRDREEMYRKIKTTVFITFIIYFGLYLMAIFTDTSGITYEIADQSKLGFKGWYDSGQILGHAYAMMLPLLMYVTLKPQRKWYQRALIILLFLISVSLIGTKTPYYITIAVLGLYLFITLFIKIFNKEHKPNVFNIVFILIMLITMLFTYRYTPVKYNLDLNRQSLSNAISSYDLYKESGYYDVYDDEIIKALYPNEDLHDVLEYNGWSRETSGHLINLFESGKVHPADMRKKEIKYAEYKYHLASFKYKIFGLGFLNQNESLALESDFTMALFSFGILGLILFLAIPICEFIIMTVYILKNLKVVDLETYMLFMGLGIFIAISIFVGYTYMYTNFSIFLMLLIVMLKLKRDLLKKGKIKDNKISFLMLHLGYGGIETAVINTANILSKDYDVELISLYNVKNNQVNRIDKKITYKYLYNGEPNRNDFVEALHNHQIFKMIKEGFKAIYILLIKRLGIIHEILNADCKYLVSTRYEFSTLLSKYGSSANIKIAEEHRYHNDDRKYINILKHKYMNIDYVFALTKRLYDDYHEFFKNNHHTKIDLVPNMLTEYPDVKSKLDKKNIVTMSRLDYGKKNDDIIRAFAKTDNKDWHLYILGDGSEMDNLKALVKELKLEKQVILPGYIKKEELSKYLVDASIFVMASLTEGLPMVLLEAMSYGIPCVAYETASGVNDIIKSNYNGYVIKDRDEKEYVKCLNKIMKDTKLRKEFGENAITTSKKFSASEIIKEWNKVLRSDENAKKKNQ